MDCISIQDIVPKERVVGSKKREFKVEKVGNGKIKVSYDAIKGKGPKPFVFPKRVELNEKLAEAVGLYVGDGSFAGHPGHSTFSNKDAELVKLMFDFFLGLGVREADMSIFISYRDGDESKIKKWWANKLGISPDKMQIKKSERHRYSTLG
ncbi:MAG: hypothetical protein ACE5FW_02485, partial [Candidatus Aenigmatarchaeota archaeon]